MLKFIYTLLFLFKMMGFVQVFGTLPPLEQGEVLYLGEQIEYLMDPGYQLSLSDVRSPEWQSQFKKSGKQYLNFGLGSKAVWIRFQIHPPIGLKEELYLDLGNPRLDSSSFFHPGPNGAYTRIYSGVSPPLGVREVPNRLSVFSLHPGKADSSSYYYARVTSILDQNLMPSLMTKSTWQSRDHRFLMVLTLVCALIGLSALIAMLHFLIFRFYLSVFYSILEMASVFAILFFHGLLPAMMPVKPGFSLVSILIPLMLIPEILFVRSFFQLSQNYRRIDLLLKTFAGFYLFFFFFSLFFPTSFLLPLPLFTQMVFIGITIWLAIKGSNNQRIPLLFFRGGVGFYFLLNGIALLMTAGILPVSSTLSPNTLFPIPAVLIRMVAFGAGVYFMVESFSREKMESEKHMAELQMEMKRLQDRIVDLLGDTEKEGAREIDYQEEPVNENVHSPSKEELKEVTLLPAFLPMLNEHLLSPLTPRENEILVAISNGWSNKEIADKLFISINTVKTHVKRIFDKLEVSNRTAAARKVLNI